MNKDDKIDIALEYFYQQRSLGIDDIYYKFGGGDDPKNIKDCDDLLDIMCHHNLIEKSSNSRYSILAEGIEIYKSGGWNRFKKRLEEENIKKIEIEKQEFEKRKYDTKLVKWQIKTFWIFFTIAIIGSLMGAISLIWQILDKTQPIK